MQRRHRNAQKVVEESALSLRDIDADLRHVLHNLNASLVRWGRVWRLPRLADRIHIEFSDRLRSTMGRCHVQNGLLRINGLLLLPQNRELLLETVCHEAAHWTVHKLHGHNVQPHGAEWKILMKSAGYEPRVTISARLVWGSKLHRPSRD